MAIGQGFTTIYDTQALTLANSPAANNLNVNLFHVEGTTYAVCYERTDGNQVLSTITIDDDGTVTTAEIDVVSIGSVGTSDSQYILQFFTNYFVIAYVNRVETWSIASDGTITNGVDTLSHGFTPNTRPILLHLGTVSGKERCMMIAHPSGSNDRGYIFDVDSSGTLTQVTASTTLNGQRTIAARRVRDDIVVGYRRVASTKGELYTITVDDDGTITASELDTQTVEGDSSDGSIAADLNIVVEAEGLGYLMAWSDPTGGNIRRLEGSVSVASNGGITYTAVGNSQLSSANFSSSKSYNLGGRNFVRCSPAASPTSVSSSYFEDDGSLSGVDSASGFLPTPAGNFDFAPVTGSIMAMAHADYSSAGNLYITTFDLTSLTTASQSLPGMGITCYIPLYGTDTETINFQLNMTEWREKIETKAVVLNTPEFTNNPLALNYAVVTLQIKGTTTRFHAVHPVSGSHGPDLIDLEEAAILWNKESPGCLATITLPLVSGDRTYRGIIQRMVLVENPGSELVDYVMTFKVAWSIGTPAFRGWA